tara:strand:+ start:426 stop:1016 length:591 start_codon:yes stop_codon:yes gene_type:complete
MNGSTELSLDDLFREAKAAMRSVAKTKAGSPPVADDPLAVWRNPDNWKRTRGIALVHSDTMQLLGNFVEYVHRTVPDARRLVRETPGLTITATEYVYGEWLGVQPVLGRATDEAAVAHRTLSLTVNISLPQLGINAPQVKVEASFAGGKLTAVELRERTLFQQQPASLLTLMYLPKGTDVFLELAAETIQELETRI